jgi:hypothetical protein
MFEGLTKKLGQKKQKKIFPRVPVQHSGKIGFPECPIFGTRGSPWHSGKIASPVVIKMIISMAKGTASFSLICLKIWVLFLLKHRWHQGSSNMLWQSCSEETNVRSSPAFEEYTNHRCKNPSPYPSYAVVLWYLTCPWALAKKKLCVSFDTWFSKSSDKQDEHFLLPSDSYMPWMLKS